METEDEKWLRLTTINVGWDYTRDTRTATMSMDQHGELVYELARLRAELAEQAAIHDEYRRLIREHIEPEIPRLTAELAEARARIAELEKA